MYFLRHLPYPDSLEVQSADGEHTINIVTETVKAEDEDTTDDTDSDTTDESSTETSDESSTDTDSSDESSSDDEEETTTTTYKLDGEDLDESTFTTFYNKLINYRRIEVCIIFIILHRSFFSVCIFKDKGICRISFWSILLSKTFLCGS